MVSNRPTVSNVPKRGVGSIATLLLGLLVATLAWPRPAGATTTTSPAPKPATTSDKIGALRAQVAEASAEESDLLDRIDTATSAVSDAQANVAEIDATIADTDRLLTDAQARLDDLTQQVT